MYSLYLDPPEIEGFRGERIRIYAGQPIERIDWHYADQASPMHICDTLLYDHAARTLTPGDNFRECQS